MPGRQFNIFQYSVSNAELQLANIFPNSSKNRLLVEYQGNSRLKTVAKQMEPNECTSFVVDNAQLQQQGCSWFKSFMLWSIDCSETKGSRRCWSFLYTFFNANYCNETIAWCDKDKMDIVRLKYLIKTNKHQHREIKERCTKTITCSGTKLRNLN